MPSRKERKENQLQASRKAAKLAKKTNLFLFGLRPMQTVTFSGIQWIQKR